MLMPRRMWRGPKRLFSSRILMKGTLPSGGLVSGAACSIFSFDQICVVAIAALPQPQLDEGAHDEIREQHEDDVQDHALGGGAADALGAVAGVQAAVAGDGADDAGEDGALEQA